MQTLFVGVALIAFSVVVQSSAAAAGVAIMEAIIRRGYARGSFLNITCVFELIVLLLLGAHVLQMAVWALLFIWCGQFREFGTALYHSAVNYTTLGYGDLPLARPWRLLGPMEAMDGILMAGVSAAILFAVLHRLVELRFSDPGPAHRATREELSRLRMVNARTNDNPSARVP